MFGIDYLTVGAYIVDGAVLCRACGEKRGLPTNDSVSVNEIENAFAHDGTFCDDCCAEVVEPCAEHCGQSVCSAPVEDADEGGES